MTNEPIAYAAVAADGSESVYVTSLKEQAEACCRENGWFLLPLYAAPPTWQEEVAAVEDAFERSGVKPTWPDDEPGNIGPMAAAMADEIRRLTLTDEELDAIEQGLEQIELHSDLESRSFAKAICGLLDRIEGGKR